MDRDIEQIADRYAVLRILVTGSRSWEDRAAIRSALLQAAAGFEPRNVTVVHGAARGADTLAADVALGLGMRVEAHPAAWRQYGRSAGAIRNNVMVGLGADLCLAWPLGDSPGTRDCMRRCRDAGIPVRNLGDPDPAAQPDLFGEVTATTTTHRLDLPRWDLGPRVPYRTKSGKVRTRMSRPVWDALTGNARTGHWAQRHKAVAKVIEAVGWAAKAAKVPAGSHLTIQLVWAPGHNRTADEDNLWHLQKVLADGLARGPRKDLPGLRLVPDDTAAWMTKLAPRIDRPPVPAGLWLELEVRR